MKKRLVTVYAVLILMAVGLVFRLFSLARNDGYARAVSSQTSASLTLLSERADFIDRNGLRITGDSELIYAVIDPTDELSASVLAFADETGKQSYERGIKSRRPFLVSLAIRPPEYMGLTVISAGARYGFYAPRHILGYLGAGGEGESGLELLFDDYLAQHTLRTGISYRKNAVGGIVPEGESSLWTSGQRGSVSLTIDREIQRLVNTIADEGLYKGSIVVMSAQTGELLACASRPCYDPDNLADAIARNDGAFVNRSLAAYPAGSVFKLLIQAAALDAGVESFTHVCTGTIAVGDVTFSCSGGYAHEEVDMHSALARSCNCFHIALAQTLSPKIIRNKAALCGFGSAMELYEGFFASAGYMPSAHELSVPAELANLSFGQGKLLVNPVQVACFVSAIANGGIYSPVSLVTAVGDSECEPKPAFRVMSQSTADKLLSAMCQTVASGTGTLADPSLTTAAGKTGTAETGVLNSDGTAKYVGWFAGVFPSDKPEYTVVVTVETEPGTIKRANALFKLVADGITELLAQQNN